MPLRECFFGDQQRTGAPLQLSMQLLDSVAADHGHVLVLESGTREREILRRRRQHQHAHIVAHRYGWRSVAQDLGSMRRSDSPWKTGTPVSMQIGRASCRERVCQYV